MAPLGFAAPARAEGPSVGDVDAAARALGNRRPLAVAIGRSIFSTDWPAQVLHVRVDGVGSFSVALLDLSAVKFHRRLDLHGFEDEVLSLARETLVAAPGVEEIDIVAHQPLRVGEHGVVSGDLALPTVRVVFTVTVRRSDFSKLAARLRAGTDVFVAPDFRARLDGP